MIGRRELGLMKPTARLINCARGSIVDEAALQEALTTGKLAGAALDVFANEPPFDGTLLDSPNLVATPHLGASTHEAQVAVAYDVAQQVVDILSGRPPKHPVNAPVIPVEVQAQLLPFCELAERLGRAARQLGETPLNQVRITYAGQLAGMDTDLLRALVVKGLFQDVVEARITPVNATLVARDHGLRIAEEKTDHAGHFANLIALAFDDAGKDRLIAGTIMHGEPFAVRVDQYWLDFVLRGYQLLAFHRDRPGIIGAVGQVTAKHDINIAFMGLGRLQPRGDALMALTLDEYAPPEVLDEIKRIPDIYSVRLLQL
jgi:D-3-phosphoglycerate dehydrogenase